MNCMLSTHLDQNKSETAERLRNWAYNCFGRRLHVHSRACVCMRTPMPLSCSCARPCAQPPRAPSPLAHGLVALPWDSRRQTMHHTHVRTHRLVIMGAFWGTGFCKKRYRLNLVFEIVLKPFPLQVKVDVEESGNGTSRRGTFFRSAREAPNS